MILTSVKLRTNEARHTLFFLMHPQKCPLFCLKRGKKIPFLGYTRKMSVRRSDRDNFTPIVGFHNDEVGCPYFQVFATNLPFGPLDDDT